MKKPDFILVGESRCGSTSLYETLIQHPNILLPTKDEDSNFSYPDSKIDISQKELRFFDRAWNKGLDWYYNRFTDEPDMISGDASATYLYHPGALERIREALPNVKVIVLLRNPIDRAISHFYHMQNIRPVFKERYETFEKFARSELVLRPYHHIIDRGLYRNVEKCLEFFPNLKIIKSEDLFSNSQTLTEVFDFLGLETPEGEILHYRKSHAKEIDQNLRGLLNKLYEPSNKKLYSLLGVDYMWH